MAPKPRSIRRPAYIPATLLSVIVTLGMAWPIAFPPVPPRAVTVREDTTNFTMFDMSGDNYVAILGAVDSGRLVATDMRDGFKLFTRGSLSKRQLNGRIQVGGKVIDQYIAEERAAARPLLIAVWAALALVLPGLYLAGRALLGRPQPLTAPPVKPEMM